MEDADKELKELEDMLRAMAAKDKAGCAEDTALLARLCDKADTACRCHVLRPWYRSPMLWRSAAALALLVSLPSLWVWLQPPAERSAVVKNAPVADVTAQLAVVTADAGDIDCGAGYTVAEHVPELIAESIAVVGEDCVPSELPLPQATARTVAVAMVEEACKDDLTTHETAVAVYCGGADCDAEESEEEWGAGAVNHIAMTDRSAPATFKRSAAGSVKARCAKAKKALPHSSIADKLKIYAKALQRAAAQP